MADKITFGCGEFLPGREPVEGGGIQPPIPPVVIPEPPIGRPPWRPRYPRVPGPGPGPGAPGPGSPRPGGPGGPNTGGGGRPGGSPGGGQGSGGGRPTTPGGGLGRPVTGFPAKYRCSSVKIYCAEDSNLPEERRRVKEILRNCSLCTPTRNPAGGFSFPSDCAFDKKSECEVQCRDSRNLDACLGRPVTGRPSIPDTQDPQPEVPQAEEVPDTQNPQPQVPGVEGIPDTQDPPGPPVTEVDIEEEVNERDPILPSQRPLPIKPVLYDPELNFFEIESDQTTNFVPNTRYPNVFGFLVAEEIKYLIDMENSTAPWQEKHLQNLTTSKVRASINPNLLNAFRSFHWPGGQVIGDEPFLEMVKKHILTGTLSELDTQYFYTLADQQKNDRRIRFTGLRDPELRERAALGILADSAINADSDNYRSIDLRQIRRQRRLNTDIRARIPVCPLGEDEESITLDNFGVCVEPLDSEPESMATGDGDGYYFYLNTADDECAPLQTESELSKSYYIPFGDRFNALSLFNSDTKIHITAQSIPGGGELEPKYAGLQSTDPIYLVLDLSSIESQPSNNPLVDTYRATYTRITDQEEITTHLNNNGFAVTRVNIDYRDPLFKYISDSGTLTLQQNDITFRALTDQRSPDNNSIFTKNIPFGLVVTPVKGSKYNPFAGYSKLTSYNTIVDSKYVAERSLGFLPSFSKDDTTPFKSELGETNLYLSTGQMRVGVYEPNDLQNYTYPFAASSLANTFLSGNSYVSGVDPVSSYGLNYLTNDVLDRIQAAYPASGEVTWFDVYRRMPINKVGELFYNSNEEILSNLENTNTNLMDRGWPRLTHVINTITDKSDKILPEDSSVIIPKSFRKNAPYY